MRVLHIVGDSKFGGGSVIISQLALNQSSQGYDVSVLTTDKEFSSYLASLNIDVVNLDCIWRNYNVFKDLYGIFKLTSFLKRNRFDIVHTHTTKAGFVGRVAAWLARNCLIIHTVHGFPFSEVSSKLKVFTFSFLEKFLFKISNRVVFVSNYHLNWACKLRIVSDVTTAVAIRNGVEPVTAKGVNFDNLKAPNIVFIGRIVNEKGVFDLLNAFNIIKNKYKELTLTFIGDGPDLQELKISALEDKDVIFTGFVNDVTSYISPDDIFVLPSYREGLSISAIEAQSMGLASVLSNIGGNMEISDNGNTALIFTASDVSELAVQLDVLLSDIKCRVQLMSNARRNYCEKFTSHRMLLEYSNLYSELIEHKE